MIDQSITQLLYFSFSSIICLGIYTCRHKLQDHVGSTTCHLHHLPSTYANHLFANFRDPPRYELTSRLKICPLCPSGGGAPSPPVVMYNVLPTNAADVGDNKVVSFPPPAIMLTCPLVSTYEMALGWVATNAEPSASSAKSSKLPSEAVAMTEGSLAG